MGRKTGRRPGSFTGETCAQATSFYRDLVQDLRLPQPKAPQLAEEAQVPSPEPEESEQQVRREQDGSLRSIAALIGETSIEQA
jgi:hypothetical protein